LKEELAKTSTPQGEKILERTYNGREGLGYVAPAKKKKKSKKKKSKAAHAKKNPIEGGDATKMPEFPPPPGPEIYGATPCPMDLREKTILTISCIVITMVMCMLSTMVPMMVMFIGLFGFPSPLLLT